MHSKQNGLTVGELTMTIGALIIAGLVWTTISKEEASKDISQTSNSYPLTIELGHIGKTIK